MVRPDAIGDARAHFERFLAEGGHGDMDWLANTPERRVDPRTLWPEVRSIVMLGLNYGPEHDPLAILEERERGAISVYAQGDDYHDVIKPRLKAVARWLVANAGGDVKVFVDTAAVMEKPLAAAAGLGWQGKHTNLVSREFGSWLFLGAIFTTLDLPPDAPEIDHCGTCQACLDICPTNAFPAPYRLDARRCISYLTIEHKGPIPRELRPLMGNRIYGCDDCLAVCPWNKFAQAGREAKLAAREALRAPKLAELARLDDAAFRALFAKSPVKRTGRDRFVRNVLIAIGNSGDAAFAADAERLLDDASPLVRGAAVWALGRLDPASSRALARGVAPRETDARCARRVERRLRMPTLFCFGLGYCAEHYVAEFGARFDRIAGTVRTREKARRDRGVALRRARSRSIRVRRQRSYAGGRRGVDGRRRAARLGAAGPRERSGARAVLRRDRGRAAPAIDRLSLDRRRLWRSRRRLGRRDDAARAGLGAQPRAARRRAGLGVARRARGQIRSRSCGSREFMAPARTRWCRSRAAARSASTSPDRCSTASMSPTSRRRSTRRSRAAPTVCSMSPTTSQRRRACRSHSQPNCLALPPPPEIPFAEAAKTMSPMALSFYGESKRVRNDKLKRELGVRLRYPTYREGLRALFEAGEGRSTWKISRRSGRTTITGRWSCRPVSDGT